MNQPSASWEDVARVRLEVIERLQRELAQYETVIIPSWKREEDNWRQDEKDALELRRALNDECDRLQHRLAEANCRLRRDAKRLDWIEQNLIECRWNGVIGCPKSWHMVGPYRAMNGDTLREAIDAAMQEGER